MHDPDEIYEIRLPITVREMAEMLDVGLKDLLATLIFKLQLTKAASSLMDRDEVELLGLEIARRFKIVEKSEPDGETPDACNEDDVPPTR